MAHPKRQPQPKPKPIHELRADIEQRLEDIKMLLDEMCEHYENELQNETDRADNAEVELEAEDR